MMKKILPLSALLLTLALAATAATVNHIRNAAIQLGTSNFLTGVVGNSGNVQQAGTVTGTSSILCTDASQNSTTASCGVTRMQTLVITTGICTTPGSDSQSCTSGPYSWPVAFTDSNYAINCMVETPTSGSSTPSLRVYFQGKSSSAFTIVLQTGTSAGGGANTTAEIDCTGVHP